MSNKLTWKEIDNLLCPHQTHLTYSFDGKEFIAIRRQHSNTYQLFRKVGESYTHIKTLNNIDLKLWEMNYRNTLLKKGAFENESV